MVVSDGVRKILILGIVLVVAALLLLGPFDLQPAQLASQLLDAVRNAGPLAPLIFIGVYIVACVAFIPGSVLTLGAGAVFGVVQGTVLVSIGSVLGATAAFLVARYLAREWAGGRWRSIRSSRLLIAPLGARVQRLCYLPDFPQSSPLRS